MQTNRLNHAAKRMRAIAKVTTGDVQQEANRNINNETMIMAKEVGRFKNYYYESSTPPCLSREYDNNNCM